jgi:hypothetical protein
MSDKETVTLVLTATVEQTDEREVMKLAVKPKGEAVEMVVYADDYLDIDKIVQREHWAAMLDSFVPHMADMIQKVLDEEIWGIRRKDNDV